VNEKLTDEKCPYFNKVREVFNVCKIYKSDAYISEVCISIIAVNEKSSFISCYQYSNEIIIIACS
jgi:hypothetical protein